MGRSMSAVSRVDVPLFTNPPNMYFVLDRSGSMGESDKWDRVRLTVARLMRGLGPRANFGAAIFPYGEALERPGDGAIGLKRQVR